MRAPARVVPPRVAMRWRAVEAEDSPGGGAVLFITTEHDRGNPHACFPRKRSGIVDPSVERVLQEQLPRAKLPEWCGMACSNSWPYEAVIFVWPGL